MRRSQAAVSKLRARALRLAQRGRTNGEIARALGISRVYAARLLAQCREAGESVPRRLPPRRKGTPRADRAGWAEIETAVQRLLEGTSAAAFARAAGVSDQTVLRALKGRVPSAKSVDAMRRALEGRTMPYPVNED